MPDTLYNTLNNKGRQLVNYRPGGEWLHAYKRYFGKHAESDIKKEYAKMQELRQIELHVSPNFNTNL